MNRDLLDQAVRNNALWCDAVCAAQGKPGDFAPSLWSSPHGTPPYYPDAVTLTPDGTDSQRASVIELISADPARWWSVKDSYSTLSLGNDGFTILFDAKWIAMSAQDAASTKPGDSTWQRIDTAKDLEGWKAAWSDGDSSKVADQIFHDALLSHPDLAFLLALEGDVPVGGAVLNHGADVVGLSNVFGTAAVWSGLVAEAAALFPGVPLVGYERDVDLEAAIAAGFEPIGPLRVWMRD